MCEPMKPSAPVTTAVFIIRMINLWCEVFEFEEGPNTSLVGYRHWTHEWVQAILPSSTN